jgi:phage tail-like protein
MTVLGTDKARAELAALRVVGAQARELARVRVSFDHEVQQVDAAGRDDALNPARYALTRVSAPAVEAVVAAVESVTSSAVDLLTDVPLTPAASYRLDVEGVADVSGTVIDAADGTAVFTGFVPPRPASRMFELYRFLPELNRREDETCDLQRFLACLQEVTDLGLVDIDRFTDILDPDIAAEPFVDLMLGELGNPFSFDLSVVDKRRLLNVLVAMYREKGTGGGIINALRFFLGLEVQVTAYAGEALSLGESLLGEDWVLGPSSRFAALAFEVVSPRLLSTEERRRLRQIVDYYALCSLIARTISNTPATVAHDAIRSSSTSAVMPATRAANRPATIDWSRRGAQSKPVRIPPEKGFRAFRESFRAFRERLSQLSEKAFAPFQVTKPSCERGDSNLHAVKHRNLNPAKSR